MSSIYREIGTALEHRLYYLAIVATVAIPDICASLEGGQTGWKPYKDWFREHGPRYRHFNEHLCYEVRCGMMHNARMIGGKDRHSGIDRAIFFPPGSDGPLHDSLMKDNGGVIESAVLMNTMQFCQEMIGAARAWELTARANPTVQENMAKVISIKPNGVFPHIHGFPVIA